MYVTLTLNFFSGSRGTIDTLGVNPINCLTGRPVELFSTLSKAHLSRYIKESIFIRVNNPTLNNNVGKFNLPHIWDRVLIHTPGLKLNK